MAVVGFQGQFCFGAGYRAYLAGVETLSMTDCSPKCVGQCYVLLPGLILYTNLCMVDRRTRRENQIEEKTESEIETLNRKRQ